MLSFLQQFLALIAWPTATNWSALAFMGCMCAETQQKWPLTSKLGRSHRHAPVDRQKKNKKVDAIQMRHVPEIWPGKLLGKCTRVKTFGFYVHHTQMKTIRFQVPSWAKYTARPTWPACVKKRKKINLEDTKNGYSITINGCGCKHIYLTLVHGMHMKKEAGLHCLPYTQIPALHCRDRRKVQFICIKFRAFGVISQLIEIEYLPVWNCSALISLRLQQWTAEHPSYNFVSFVWANTSICVFQCVGCWLRQVVFRPRELFGCLCAWLNN